MSGSVFFKQSVAARGFFNFVILLAVAEYDGSVSFVDRKESKFGFLRTSKRCVVWK